MAHPLIRGFFDRIETDEIVPLVPPVPGVRLPDYQALIARRFANPKVGDTIRRLCLDGSNRSRNSSSLRSPMPCAMAGASPALRSNRRSGAAIASAPRKRATLSRTMTRTGAADRNSKGGQG